MKSPMARILLPAKRSSSASGGIRGRNFRYGPIAVGGHRRPALAADNHERKPRPGNQPVQTAPDPHSLVENLQYQLADFARAEHLAMHPPGGRTGFVEVVRPLHVEAMGLEKLPDVIR